MPEKEFADTVIKNMTPRHGSPEGNFLDFVTASILERTIYDKTRDLKYTGISSMLFPEHYSSIRRNSGSNNPYPSTYRTEFIIHEKEDSKVRIKFCYLKPILRGLREKNNGRWVALGSSPRSVNGVEHRSGTEEPIEKILDIGEFKLSELKKKRFSTNFNFKDRRNEHEINSDYKYVFDEPNNSIFVDIGCRQYNGDKIIVSVEITNITPISTSVERGYSLDDIAKKSFYGCHTRIETFNCKIEDLTSPDSEICNSINTFPVISRENSHEIFSSPLIVYDSLTYSPVKLEISFKDLAESEDQLKKSMYLLTNKQKDILERSGKIKKILEIVRALGKSLDGKVTNMHKFQWDAIQKFIAKIVDDRSSPMIIRAPTGSGKSLVFYTCCVLMKELSEGLRGTIAFVTFPTRALNSQQFGEMVKFFFYLNKAGINITLGMYMGKNDEGAVKALDPKEYNEGDAITVIDSCPACGNKEIITSKPSKERIIPKCANLSCNTHLSFIFLSNRETQKFCPNVVVGTPDKLVNALSHDLYTHSIFGAPCRKCPKCDSCKPLCMKDQKDDIIKCDSCEFEMTKENNFASTPCFVVFDEIHSLSGTQGNLFSHFLSLMKVLNEFYNNSRKFWYLGASATVANQNELLYNLTGYPSGELMVFPNKDEYIVDSSGNGYFEKSNKLKHRYVILEPLTLSTRGAISQTVNYVTNCIDEASKLNLDVIKNLANSNLDVEKSYGTQTVYVLRKNDGRDIEKYIPENAVMNGIERPRIRFGSGDLSSEEISQLHKAVKGHELDVLVVTQIYGQGVDFPGLNIIHFFGTPRTFIEFHQVVGRTGRSKAPGLVVIHLSPSIPRDEWVYHNFRKMMIDIDGYYEPTPINYANKYAVSLSIPNIIHTMLMARTYNDHMMRYTDYVSEKLNSDEKMLREILDDVVRVYVRDEMREQDKIEIKKEVGLRLIEILQEFGNYKETMKNVLTQKNILVGTLRRRNKKIPYMNRNFMPVIGKLKTSRS